MVRRVIALVLVCVGATTATAQDEPLSQLISRWSSPSPAVRERASTEIEARWESWTDGDRAVLESTAARHPDLELRTRAAVALRAIDAQERSWLERDAGRNVKAAHPRLVRLARHAEPAVSVTAIALLGRAPDAADEPLLAELVASPHDRVALAAIAALGARKAAAHVPALEPALRRAATRTAALDALVAIGGRAATACVARQLDAPELEARVAAMRALGRVGAADHVELVLAFVADGREIALAAAGMDVLRATEGEAVVRAARTLVDHAQAPQRHFALDLVGQRRDRESIPAIVRHLDDEHVEVRLMAVRALVRLGATDRLARRNAADVLAALADGRRNAADVAELVMGLIAMGADDTVPALAALLDRNDPVCVEAGLAGLVQLGARAEAPRIAELLRRDAPALHLAALRALAALGVDAHRGLLAGLLARTEPGLGDLAAAELVRLAAVDQADAVVAVLATEDRAVKCRALGVLGALAPGAHTGAIAAQLAVEPIEDAADPAAAASAILLALDPGTHAPAVARLLADPRPTMRARVLGLLGRWRATTQAAEVGRALDDRDLEVRRAAIEALGLLGDRARLDRIVAALANEGLERTAAHALVRIRAVDQLAAMRALLVHRDDRIRGYALLAYRKLASPAQLVELLRIESPNLRDLTQAHLRSVGAPTIEPLVALSRWPEESSEARRAAVETAVAIDPARAVRELFPLVVGSGGGYAAVVGDALAASTGGRFPEEYAEYLDHASPVVVREAIKVASRHGGAVYADRFARLLESHPSRLVRQQALEALREVGGPAQLPSVRAALQDSSHTIRGMAVQQLGRRAGPEVAKDVARLLTEVDFDTRQHALRALGRLATRHAELREAAWLAEALEALAVPREIEGHLHVEQRYGALAVLIRLGARTREQQVAVLRRAIEDRAENKLFWAIHDVLRALEAVHEPAAVAKLDAVVQVRVATPPLPRSEEEVSAALRDCAAQVGVELVAGRASVYRLPVGMRRSFAEVLDYANGGSNRPSGVGYALRGGVHLLASVNEEQAYALEWVARLQR